jgi:hypothetical protein
MIWEQFGLEQDHNSLDDDLDLKEFIQNELNSEDIDTQNQFNALDVVN